MPRNTWLGSGLGLRSWLRPGLGLGLGAAQHRALHALVQAAVVHEPAARLDVARRVPRHRAPSELRQEVAHARPAVHPQAAVPEGGDRALDGVRVARLLLG